MLVAIAERELALEKMRSELKQRGFNLINAFEEFGRGKLSVNVEDVSEL